MYSVDGCCSIPLRRIWVDKHIHDDRKREYRYRFTLGHEIGHFVLHDRILEKARIESPDDWFRFVDSMPETVRSKFEWQAYTFSGLVLVAPHHLKAVALRRLSEVKQTAEVARRKGLKRSDYLPYAKNVWAVRIAPAFNVSYMVIERRLESDGLLEFI